MTVTEVEILYKQQQALWQEQKEIRAEVQICRKMLDEMVTQRSLMLRGVMLLGTVVTVVGGWVIALLEFFKK